MSKEAAGGARKSRRFMKKTITFSMIMVTVKITVKTKCLKCSFQLDWSRFASALTLQCFGTTKITVSVTQSSSPQVSAYILISSSIVQR